MSAPSRRWSASRPIWSTSHPRARCSGSSRASSCMPGHRSAGTVRPGRSAAGLWPGSLSRGWSRPRRTRRAVRVGHRCPARALPPPRHRWTDGRRRHPEHVDVRPRGPPDRRAHAVLAQRRARQGAALRRLPAEVSSGWAGCATSWAHCCRPRSARRDTSGPVDVTGILTQMLQMGDEAHNRNRAGTLMLLRDLSPAMVIAEPTPPTCGVAPLHWWQRPLLPQPRDARVQAGTRCGARHRRLDDGGRDGAQRHGLRDPGSRHR